MNNSTIRVLDLDDILWEDEEEEQDEFDADTFIARFTDLINIAVAKNWRIPQISLNDSLFNQDMSWEAASKLVPSGALSVEHPPLFMDSDIEPMLLGEDLCLMDYNGFCLWCIVRSGEVWSIYLISEDDFISDEDFRGDAFKDILHKSGQRFWRLRDQVKNMSPIGVIENGVLTEYTLEVSSLYNILRYVLAEISEDPRV